MKAFLLPLLFLPVFFFSLFSLHKPQQAIAQPVASDTCFYELRVPADLDLPSTPLFDTTIVRSSNCKIHILKLQSWGTETEYRLTGTIKGKTYQRSAHFFHGETNGKSFIDITNLPAGNYGISLLACGNGGGFGLTIR